MNTNFEDVGDFHRKFDLPTSDDHDEAGPRAVDEELFLFRFKFMLEELQEFQTAWLAKDEAGQFDALIDLVYVALGTAHFFGFPWQDGWDEVQRANMQKVRASSTNLGDRKSTWDVLKPKGWQPPDIEGVLKANGW